MKPSRFEHKATLSPFGHEAKVTPQPTRAAAHSTLTAAQRARIGDRKTASDLERVLSGKTSVFGLAVEKQRAEQAYRHGFADAQRLDLAKREAAAQRERQIFEMNRNATSRARR
jgi:hypothetical protein